MQPYYEGQENMVDSSAIMTEAEESPMTESELLQSFAAGVEDAATRPVNPTVTLYRHKPASDGTMQKYRWIEFKIQSIQQPRWQSIRRRETENSGKPTERLNWARFSAAIIYEGTTEQYRKLLWDNRDAWRTVRGGPVINHDDFISLALEAGEVVAVFEAIQELSQLRDDATEVIRIKNS